MRIVPHHAHQAALQQFDTAVQACLESFPCCSFDALEWKLATLTTRLGGLGLRSAALHSSAACYASQAACHEQCQKLDPNCTWDCTGSSSDATVNITLHRESACAILRRRPHTNNAAGIAVLSAAAATLTT